MGDASAEIHDWIVWLKDHLFWIDGAPLRMNLPGPIFLVSLLGVFLLILGAGNSSDSAYHNTYALQIPWIDLFSVVFGITIVSGITSGLVWRNFWSKIAEVPKDGPIDSKAIIDQTRPISWFKLGTLNLVINALVVWAIGYTAVAVLYLSGIINHAALVGWLSFVTMGGLILVLFCVVAYQRQKQIVLETDDTLPSESIYSSVQLMFILGLVGLFSVAPLTFFRPQDNLSEVGSLVGAVFGAYLGYRISKSKQFEEVFGPK